MEQDLVEIISVYSTGSREDFLELMSKKDRPILEKMFTNLLTLYINDKNSSTLREYIVVAMSGFSVSTKKLGYNGYKTDTPGSIIENCEAKPVNVDSSKPKPKLRKLNGGGNFSDYTWDRHKKAKKSNLTIAVGGFVDGRLIYIFNFPYNTPSFTNRLEEQLHKEIDTNQNRYVRSASFSYKHFWDPSNVDIIYICDASVLEENKDFIQKGLYEVLVGG